MFVTLSCKNLSVRQSFFLLCLKSYLFLVEESNAMGANAPVQGTTKIFQDSELALMIDPILDMDDRNKDGFIDYPEFIAAQKSRGF